MVNASLDDIAKERICEFDDMPIEKFQPKIQVSL